MNINYQLAFMKLLSQQNMNRRQLRKNFGTHVRIRPIAARRDPFGRSLMRLDDDWFISGTGDDGIRISNERTGHFADLGFTDIHHFTGDPGRSRDTAMYGVLTLNVQLGLRGNNLDREPTLRPGLARRAISNKHRT